MPIGFIAAMAISALGKWLASRNQSKDRDRERFLEQTNIQNQREDEQRNSMASFLNDTDKRDADERQSQGNAGLAATQMDPFAHARAQNRANVRRSFASSLGPGGYSNGRFDMSALDDDNMARNAEYFYNNAAAAQPNVPLGGMNQNSERFRQQYQARTQADKDRIRQQIMDFLGQIGSQTNQPIPTGR